MTPASLRRQRKAGLISDALKVEIDANGGVVTPALQARLDAEAAEAMRKKSVRPPAPRGAVEPLTPRPSPVLSGRPGSLVKWCLWKLTGQVPSPHCSCAARAKQMDEWGWAGCLRRRGEIIDWFVEAAAQRGHRVDRSAVRTLLKAAFREVRQRLIVGPSTSR